MKRFAVTLSVLIIAGHLLTEASEISENVFPYLKKVYIHPFIDPDYKFPYPQGVNILWWIYYCTNDFLWIVTFFVSAMIAAKYSFRLFRVCVVFFIYHVVDHFMLWYNYKTGHVVYWLMGAAFTGAIISMFLPERKTGRVAAME